ncbi:MAG: efflux RND transporter periplasmic adaptor subunit, partial [Vulcanimicrobiaceae bacterium]
EHARARRSGGAVNAFRLAFARDALALLVALCACARGDNSGTGADAQASTPPVSAGAIRLVEEQRVLRGYGTIAGGPNAQAALAFPEAGRIAAIPVEVGDRVAAGTVLAQLDSGLLDAQVAQARAGLAAAQANAAKVRAGARPQVRSEVAAQIAQADSALELARASAAREATLYAAGVASRAELEAARAQLAQARAAVAVLEQQRSADIHPLPQDVAGANAETALAQAQLESALRDRAFASLRAPFAGVVTARLHSVGEYVDQTSPVIELASDRQPTFTALFAPADAARIAVGTKATVTFRGGATLRGRVSAIDLAQTQSSRLVPVLIRLARDDPNAGPGAYGEASVRIGETRELVVPSSAIVADATTGASLVFRKRAGRYGPVPVQVLSRDGDRTAIASDELHAGDLVVVRGAEALAAPAPPAAGD